MSDKLGIYLRLRHNALLTALRRIIPGDYKELCEIHSPELLELLGLDFSFLQLTSHPPAGVMPMFFTENLGERQEPLSSFLRNKGNWCVSFVDKESTAANSIWLFTVIDYPDQFFTPLRRMGAGSGMLIRPLKQGWLISLPLLSLKHFTKHANSGRGDYEL